MYYFSVKARTHLSLLETSKACFKASTTFLGSINSWVSRLLANTLSRGNELVLDLITIGCTEVTNVFYGSTLSLDNKLDYIDNSTSRLIVSRFSNMDIIGNDIISGYFSITLNV